MIKKLYIGTIQKMFSEKNFGFIESIEHMQLYFSFKQLKDDLNTGDKVVYKVHHSARHEGKLEAIKIKKLYTSKNKQKIIFSDHLKVDPTLCDFITTKFNCIELVPDAAFIEEELTYDKRVNKKLCVAVDHHADIIFAKREGKSYYSKFVIDRNPEATDKITIIFKRIEGVYHVIAAFWGPIAHPEVWDKNANPDTPAFWKDHALILDDSLPIKPSTITRITPEYFDIQ